MSLVGITPAQAREHLKLTTPTVDSYITSVILGIESWMENELGIKLKPTEIVERLDGGVEMLRLSWGPVTSVASVIDMLDEETEIEDTEYFVTKFGIEREIESTVWERGRIRYKVTYTAGYAPDNMPDGLKLCVFMLLGRFFSNRDDRSSEGTSAGSSISWRSFVDSDIRHLLNQYSMREFA